MKNIYIILIIFLAISFGIFTYLYMSKGEKDIQSKDITKDNFVLTYSYIGDNKWTYTLTGTLPNPCYTVSVDALVAESYPEQVSIIATVTPPEDDIACIQVVQEYEHTGDFSASEKAIVTLQVK